MGAVAVTSADPSGDDLRQVFLREDSMLPVATTSVATKTGSTDPAPAVWLVGAHGGAGCTTLAHLCAPMGDAGQVWPAAEENPFCIVVCRSTKHGLERAHQAALQARAGEAGEIILLGVAIVEDTPEPCPKVLERKISVIERHFRTWRIPYLEEVRTVDLDELASWEPGDEHPQPRRKLGRKKPPLMTEVVPTAVMIAAEDIFSSAAEAHNKQKEEIKND